MRKFFLLFALVLAPALATAQPAGMRGTFVLNRAASDDVNAAIDRTVASLNMVVRQVARPRLRRSTQPAGRIVIGWTPAEVTIQTDNRAPLRTAANGTALRWRNPDGGEAVNVSTMWHDAHLMQTFAAEDGRRVNMYALSADGRTLTLDVNVSSPRLSRPLTYRLVYTKQ